MSDPLFRLSDVAVRFGRQTVLAGLNLEILPHQSVAVVGESGCGKTVLLKLLVGLLAPNAGDVTFEGRSVAKMSERDLTAMRRRVGFLFQQSALFDSLTVFDNVAFGVRAQGGLDDRQLRERVVDRLGEVGLPAGVDVKMPAELSGGMRKRVALARALALDPDVMLYDEPTTGLDPIMTDVINELILKVRRRRPVTGVIVTHEMKTVQKTADRVVMLLPAGRVGDDRNQVIYDGPPAGMAIAEDLRVRQFLAGEAGDRLKETSE